MHFSDSPQQQPLQSAQQRMLLQQQQQRMLMQQARSQAQLQQGQQYQQIEQARSAMNSGIPPSQGLQHSVWPPNPSQPNAVPPALDTSVDDSLPAATISSDHAEGTAAQQDKGLRDLFGDGGDPPPNPQASVLPGSSGYYQSPPAPVSYPARKTSLPLPAPIVPYGAPATSPLTPSGASRTSSTALQDYNMQLMLLERQKRRRDDLAKQAASLQDHQMQRMLLERQNSKRLKMAKQEHAQESTSESVPETAASDSVDESADNDGLDQDQDVFTSGSDQTSSANPGPASDQTLGKRDASSQDELVNDSRKRPANPVSLSAEFTDWLDTSHPLSQDTTHASDASQRLARPFETIYTISCGERTDARRHPGVFYRDIPLDISYFVAGTNRRKSKKKMAKKREEKRNAEKQNEDDDHDHDEEEGNPEDENVIPHLNGRSPIHNIDDFVKMQSKLVPFFVVKTVNCTDARRLNSQSAAYVSWSSVLCIVSDDLFHAIKAVARYGFNDQARSRMPRIGYYNGQSRDWEMLYHERQIQDVGRFLYHHRGALKEHARLNPKVAPDIMELLRYTEVTYGADFAAADEMFVKGLVNEKHYTKLYIPNETVIIREDDGLLRGAVLQDNGNSILMGTGMNCWSWFFTGHGIERKYTATPALPVLSREPVPIASLPVRPLRYTDGETINKLAQRGRKQCAHLHSHHVSYTGWNKTRDDYYPDDRFMIDLHMYRKMHPAASAFKPMPCPPCSLFDHWPVSIARDAAAAQDWKVHLSMPPDTYGFYLTEKRWINIMIDGVEPPRWNKAAFERLVLPSNKKELVKALVAVRTSQRGIKRGLGVGGKREDLISGKGNGLIMLLHGGPGTGKSLTAESVAEIAEMPLYRVTCGDIGTRAVDVEKYMTTVLGLGRAWNCVLLLDEADVFLEERSMADLERNSLVSVFLRILEYYDGILVLTSNRVGTFDEAFRSRIQVALHYEPLNRTSRKKVWRNFFDMLEEDGEDADLDGLREHLNDLAEIHVNGRQIRNCLTTARQLAIYRRERLEWQHLEQAVRVSADFSSYVRRIQGGSADEDWARDGKLR